MHKKKIKNIYSNNTELKHFNIDVIISCLIHPSPSNFQDGQKEINRLKVTRLQIIFGAVAEHPE